MDQPNQEVDENVQDERRKKPQLSINERKQVLTCLIQHASWVQETPKLARNAIALVARKFSKHRSTIGRIWMQALKTHEREGRLTASPKRRVGRRVQYNPDDVVEAIEAVPTEKTSTLRSIAQHIGISKTTLIRLKANNKDVIIPDTNNVKPLLNEGHKAARVFYCHSKIDQPLGQYYTDWYQTVHVDEKWFFITQEQLKMYLTPRESEQQKAPVRRVKNKQDIMKVMFSAAVARPRYNDHGDCIFDGKIGIWPFVEQVAAQRSSVNKPQGTIETKPINVNATAYRTMLIQKVVPAIIAKFPHRNKNIVIQQDGAPSHIKHNDRLWRQSQELNTWNITLETQPAHSPDTNILDLGFFRSLQADQWKQPRPNDINGLIGVVERAYDDFQPIRIDKTFVTLSTCLNEIISSDGDNTYRIPHIGKDAIIKRDGKLPRHVALTEAALECVERNQSIHEEQVLDDLTLQLEEWNELDELEQLLRRWDEDDHGQTQQND